MERLTAAIAGSCEQALVLSHGRDRVEVLTMTSNMSLGMRCGSWGSHVEFALVSTGDDAITRRAPPREPSRNKSLNTCYVGRETWYLVGFWNLSAGTHGTRWQRCVRLK